MALPRELAHLRIQLKDILDGTDNFDDANLIGEGGFVRVYKGTLSQSKKTIDIAARRFHPHYVQGEVHAEFWKEIMMLHNLKHKNVVKIIGFCDENDEKIIINKYVAKGSLDKYLSDPTLTWMQRLQICVDVAHALKYIHYHDQRDFSVVHRNIKSSKILLNENWEPELYGFEISLKHAKARRHRALLAEDIGTIGYVDPTYKKIGFVTHKSDVYSLGVVLFEVLCGRRAFIPEKCASSLTKTSLYNIRILGSIAILATSFREWKLFGYGTQPPTISTGDSSEHEQPSTQIVTQTDAMAQHDPHTEVPEQTHSPHSSIDSSSKEQPFNPLYTMKRLDQYIHSPNDEFLSILAKSHYKFFTLGDIIDPDLRKQMAQQSFDLFADIAYSCIKKKRPQRPNIDQVVATLEEALKRQREHDLMQSNPAVKVEGLSLKKKLKAENLEHLNVPFTKIVSATKNFAETHLIGSGTYGKVYKGVLELPVEKKNKNNISKRTVAIKRILFREDEQGIEGFIAEILLLTKCKHPNIVSLLGFCHEGSHMILVYEYASNGSLDAYLGNKYNYLTWEQRIKICIDIAHGLHYLHTREEIDQRIIHRDIKSGNILLGKNLEAKISDFGLSKLYPNRTEARSYYTNIIAGTKLYLDPEYAATGKLKRGTDIYSFGVVLFEILSGKIANDRIFTDEDKKGLAPYAQRRFKEGTLHEMMDPKIMEEVDEHISTLNKGLNQDSLITFSKIAYECLAETQVMRPTAEIIIKELEKALVLQKNHKNKLQISFEDISKATQNFNDDNLIGEGPFCKVYKGEGIHAHGCNTIAVKRLNTSSLQGDYDFLMELEILVEHKRENIMGLVGYYNKEDEKIIVCEYAHNGSLDKHLDDISVSWVKRLNICIDVASGLAFLHKGAPTKEMVIHNDIKSSNILLNDEWKAKITDFGLSVIPIEYNERVGGYVDAPFITKESDIYSFGVVLFEVLSGRSIVTDKHKYDQQDLTATKDIVFEHIERYIAPESLNTFRMIASRCIDDEMEKRPTAEEALGQLKKALEIQEGYDIWEPKLPKDYKEIIQMSKSPEIYSDKSKKELYYMFFTEGILLQQDTEWFSFGDKGERNKMISASEFSYINDRSPHEWHPIPESKFKKVAEVLDTTNLMIKIKIRTDLLSPNVTYGVHLLFKFCDSSKVSSKPAYVNLKYKKGSETLYAYFATWRDDNWMTVELCRFLNQEEVKPEKIEPKNDIQHVMESDMSVDQVQQLLTNYDEGEKLFSLTEVNGKKHPILPAKEALHDSTNVRLFTLKSSADSRFHEVIELLPQQVFRIDCKIESHMLSPDTKYVCYLVFKLSEQRDGLHCPVKVRDLLQRKTEEAGIIYLIPPSPWNIHDFIKIPRQRTDELMEVEVWKFNSTHDLKNNCLPMNLRFTSYEGTMSGLIVCGLEFRPM
ncbi:serine/threonine-protein kinase, active site protein [Artemisia annua]|uniref:non-specific serine/threonine protein kinase n=1 Tax=Artemisia annua TaxID=35608 RepID=A0A2U1L6T0_ARTAN|nr:serine/threonine-protein kinase, active site protein [Artemisia annua]